MKTRLCPTFAGAVLLQPIPVDHAALHHGETIGFPGLKKKPGRPRKYPSNAARQAAYRGRKEEIERKGMVEALEEKIRIPEGRSLSDARRMLQTLPIVKLRTRYYDAFPDLFSKEFRNARKRRLRIS